MADIFLFDGSWYKRGKDDGRLRVPLAPGLESQTIMYDPELQADAQASLGGRIHMNKYAEIFDGLAVGDAVYIHLVPDAMGVRGYWMSVQDPLPGFGFDMDIVSVQDVYAAIEAGNLGTTVAGYTPAVPYTFDVGLGDSSIDAKIQAHMNDGVFTDYRHPEAHIGGYYADPVFLRVGMAAYIRLTVTSLPTEVEADGCETTCNSCGGGLGWPELQYGLIVDRTCFSKNEARTYCSCNDPICAGCDSKDAAYE